MIATLGGDDFASALRLWSTRLGPRHPQLILAGKLPGGPTFNESEVRFSRDGRLLAVQPPRGRAVLFRVPSAPDLRQSRLQTWYTLGARRDLNGQVHAIAGDEWSKLRNELLALDRTGQAIQWDELEAAFEKELVAQAQKIDKAIAELPEEQRQRWQPLWRPVDVKPTPRVP